MRASKQIDETRIRIEGKAASLIDQILAIARELDMGIHMKRLSQMRASLRTSASDAAREEVFKIVVCGRFRNGKSTFINALLANVAGSSALPSGYSGPMPTADGIPTTATVTQVRYAETPYVKAWHFDNTSEDWSFARYLREARLWTDEEDNSRRFENIKMFEIGYPADLLKSGVTLIDSPGVDEDPRRTETTREAIADAAASIIVFRTDAFASESEQAFSSEVRVFSGKTFTVINRFHGRELDRQFLTMAAQRLELDKKQFVENPAMYDVYGVDVLSALAANTSAGPQGGGALEASGMVAFEKRLSRFLLEERYPAYVEHFVKGIDQIAVRVEEGSAQRRMVLKAERARLDEVLDDCSRKLDDIQKRQERIGRIVERATNAAERAALQSYRALALDLVTDVPREFMARPIPSLESILDKMKALVQKRYVQDAVKILNAITVEKLRAWSEAVPPAKGLSKDLEPTLNNMSEEVAEELERIDSALADIRLRISTLDPTFDPEGQDVVSLAERLAWAGLGLLLQNPLMALGGVAGWRGVFGGLAAGIGIAVVLAVFHVVLAPAALIAVIWASVFSGGTIAGMLSVEKTVRQKALATYEPALRALRDDPKITDEITRNIRAGLTDIGDRIQATVDQAIREERSNLEQLRDANRLSLSDKDALMTRLDGALVQLKRTRSELRDLIADAKQSS